MLGISGIELLVTGIGFVRDRTKLDVAAGLAGSIPQSKVLVLPFIAKHGSWMLFPTVQRQASVRYGAAIELVQQEPLTTGMELAGCGTKATICVGVGVGVGATAVFWSVALLPEIGIRPKNCPIPKIITSKKTIMTVIF